MNPNIKRKDRIVISAIEIIDEMGFQGLTTKEICNRQKFSEGSLYKHFKSKDEIILEMMEIYSQFDDNINQTIETNSFSSKDGILFFISRLAEYCENYPAMTAILSSYETFLHEPGVSHKIVAIYEYRFSLIKNLIDGGKKTGEFSPWIDSESLSDIVYGTFSTMCQKWRMSQYSFSLKEKLQTAIHMILDAY